MKKLWSKYAALPVQVRASLWFLVCAFLQKGISLITTPIFTRLFATEEYGAYNVFISWQNVLVALITLHLSADVYAQGLVKFESERAKFSSSLLGLTTVLSVASFAIYWAGQAFWNNLFTLSTPIMVALFVSLWSTSSYSFWIVQQRTDYKYKAVVALTVFVSFVKPVSGVIFVLLFPDFKVEARIISMAIVDLLAFTGLYVSQMRRGRVFIDRFYWKYALKFNLPLVPHYLAQTVLNSSDRIMINAMTGSSQAGIYSLAYSISLIMQIANTALMSTMAPWIYRRIKHKDYNKIGAISYYLLILVAGLNLILIALAPEAVKIFAPVAYHEAIWVIPPVTMSVYFMFMYDLYAKFLFYYEKTKSIMFASCFAALLNVILNYVFINRFGYMAASYTTLICFIIYAMWPYFILKHVQKKHMDNAKVYNSFIILLISLVFMASGFSLMLLYEHLLIRYTLVGVGLLILLIGRSKWLAAIKQLKKT